MGQPEDSLSVEDDELDRHHCMLPLIHLVEKAAALFQVPSYIAAQRKALLILHQSVCTQACSTLNDECAACLQRCFMLLVAVAA